MSRWSDYGFPDISGVHVQTALEGLAAALDERCYAVAGAQSVDAYHVRSAGASPISDAMLQLEYSIRDWLPGNYPFVLPDGTRYTLADAAAYLGEELIGLPIFTRTQGYDWNNPFPAIGYDWIMQRYRILNLMYRTKYSGIDESLEGRSNYGGTGRTVAEAVAEANEQYYETAIQRYISTHGSFRARIGIERVTYSTDHWYSARLDISLPKKLIYRLYVPAVLTMEGTVSAPENGTFNSFGTGLSAGEAVVPITLPADVEFGTQINFATESIVTAFRSTVPPSAGTFGFEFDYDIFSDFRPSLEFYDPTEGD